MLRKDNGFAYPCCYWCAIDDNLKNKCNPEYYTQVKMIGKCEGFELPGIREPYPDEYLENMKLVKGDK